MPQFTVYRNPRRSAEHAPYLLEVQPDLVPSKMCVVVPLVNPDYYVVAPIEIGSLPRSPLGAALTDLRSARPEVMAALDFLLTGIR